MDEGKVAADRGGGAQEAEMMVALRHELRRRILRAMFEEEGPISPRRLSEVLKEPLSNVSYHVRVLGECAAVELVDQKPVRGSMQHFYVPKVEQPWALAMLGVDADGRLTATAEAGSPPSAAA